MLCSFIGIVVVGFPLGTMFCLLTGHGLVKRTRHRFHLVKCALDPVGKLITPTAFEPLLHQYMYLARQVMTVVHIWMKLVITCLLFFL